MKNNYTHKVRGFVICGLMSLFSLGAFAQVGIGTTTPNAAALLDVDATIAKGGLLLPRVALTGTANFDPLSAHVAGMTIYNTATVSDVTPGYYYNDGGKWVRIAAASVASNDWTITGNAGTTVGTNFLGTKDERGLRFRTRNFERFEITDGNANNNNGGGRLRAFLNGLAGSPTYSWQSNPTTGMFQQSADVLGFSTAGTERMRLLTNGQVVINKTTAPLAGDRLTVQGADTEDAINGYTTNGTGVFGQNTTGAGNGVFGNSSNVGVRGIGAYGGYFQSQVDGAYGVIAMNTAASGVNRTAIMASGQNLGLLTFPNTGAILYGTSVGGVGFATDATGGTGLAGVGNGGDTANTLVNGSGLSGTGDTGVYAKSISVADGTGVIGVGNNIATATVLTDGSGVAGTGNQYGVYGRSTSPTANQIFGGVFSSEFGGLAYVGGWAGATRYKIMGNGSVSTIVKDVNDEPIIMFAPESPEILLQDYGVGKLSNGAAKIKIDPNLSKNIRVDDAHPLKVFVTLEGDCNGIYVTNKSANEFTVKELQNGHSNVSFSWSIVATRADEKMTNKRGDVRISDNSVRFPAMPQSIEQVEKEVNATKSSVGADDKTMNNAIQINSKTKAPVSQEVSGASTKSTNDSSAIEINN